MIDAGFIVDRRIGQRRRFFLDELTADAHIEARPGIQQDILAALQDQGTMTQTDLRALFPSIAKATLQYHLKRLVDEGTITRDRVGKSTTYGCT